MRDQEKINSVGLGNLYYELKNIEKEMNDLKLRIGDAAIKGHTDKEWFKQLITEHNEFSKAYNKYTTKIVYFEQNQNQVIDEPINPLNRSELLTQQKLKTKPDVEIYHNDETGVWYYSVVIAGDDYWLNSFDKLEDAKQFCLEHGLKIVNIFA